MKKLLILAFILSLAVMGFAADARGVWIELSGAPQDIFTFVNTPVFENDPDFLLTVVNSAVPATTISTATSIGLFIGVFQLDPGIGNMAWAYVDQQVWANNWPVASTLTFTLTYLPTGLSATYPVTVTDGVDDIFMTDLMNPGDTWNINALLGTVVVDTWTYNLQVNGPAGYAVTGPFPGTTDYFATTGPLSVEGNTMVGDYTIGAAPMYTHWAVNPINVTAGMFTGAKVEHTYNATIEFVLVDNIYTVSIGESTPAGAAIWFNGENTGFTAPHDFTGTAAEVFGTYTLKFPGYEDRELLANENASSFTGDALVLDPIVEPPADVFWYVYTTPAAPPCEIWFQEVPPFPTPLPPAYFTGQYTPYTFTNAEIPGWGDPEPQNPVYITIVTPAGWYEPDPTQFEADPSISYNFPEPPYGFEFVIMEEINVPVELSSFTATLTADLYVTLTWVSESETNLTGYRVYRNTTTDQATAELIDHPFVPAHNTSSTQVYNVTDEDVTVGTYYYWLESVEYNTSDFHGPVSVTVESNNNVTAPPMVTLMESAYPNPFRTGGSTNIKVTLKDSGTVTIYNILGQVVRTFAVNQGNNTITWNGKDSRGNACGNGIYFYKLSTPSYNETKKLVIVK